MGCPERNHPFYADSPCTRREGKKKGSGMESYRSGSIPANCPYFDKTPVKLLTRF